jgi:hypothetical protein
MKETQNEEISTSTKWQLFFVAWVAVLLAGAFPHPSQVLLAPFFPIGLLALLPNGEDKAMVGWMQIFPSFLGWGFYGLITAALLRIRKRKVFSFRTAYSA